MKYKIVVHKKRKHWYWKLEHRNGHVLASSETYSSRYKACQTAHGVYSDFRKNNCDFIIKGGRNGTNKYTQSQS